MTAEPRIVPTSDPSATKVKPTGVGVGRQRRKPSWRTNCHNTRRPISSAINGRSQPRSDLRDGRHKDTRNTHTQKTASGLRRAAALCRASRRALVGDRSPPVLTAGVSPHHQTCEAPTGPGLRTPQHTHSARAAAGTLAGLSAC